MKKDFNSLLKVLTLASMAKLKINYEPVVDQIEDWTAGAIGFLSVAVQNKGVRISKAMAQSFANVLKSLDKNATSNPKAYARIEADLLQVGEWLELNRKLGNWARLSELTTDQTTFLDTLRKIIIKDSESSAKWLQTKIGLLHEPLLVKCFAGDMDEEFPKPADFPRIYAKKTDQQIWDKLCDLARDLGAPEDKVPGIGSQKEAREKDPDTFALWQAGRKYLSEKAKHVMAKLVRNYGVLDVAPVPVVPVKELIKLMDEQGIVWPMLSKRLKRGELIADNGTVYTKQGLSLGRTVPADALIQYNPNYTHEYSDKFSQGRGGMYYIKIKPAFAEGYSSVSPIGRAASNKDKTFGKVDSFSKDIDKFRNKWTAKLNARDEEERMAATILEIVFQSSIRIGSKLGSATVEGKSVHTYGLTMLQVRHATVVGKTVKLKYVGKAGQLQNQTLKANGDAKYQKAIDNFISYLKDKDKTDLIFTLESGGRFTSAMANTYLKRITGNSDISIHKFRHVKANAVATPILEKCPFLGKTDNSRTEVNKWFKENMKHVGEALGHFNKGETTGTTAIYSYIDPRISKKFFEDCNVQVPKEVEKLLKNDD